ncbi:MAG: ATP-binding protein [Cyanobacteriota bacterium]|nr:ATP-binding protein [Cyanobacteriota bacterium]
MNTGQTGIPLRVLLVEDNEDDALLILRELRRGGYILGYQRVETPPEMLAALQQQTWDLVIADYTLPQFSAPAALALLQVESLDLPFVVISGTMGEDQAVAAMKAGAHDYLMKSNLARLLPAVEREMRDASERRRRRQAEYALQQSERRFRTLIENASDLVMLIDATGLFYYVSPSTERILGVTGEQLLGRSLFDWIHPDDHPLVRVAFTQTLEQLASPLALQFRLQENVVNWRIFEVLVKLFQDPTGLTGLVLNARDLTERHHIEAIHRTLEHERKLNELKLRFFSMASHEFRTPLSTILLSAQLLESSRSDRLDAKELRNLKRIQEATKSLTQMLTDILTIARAEAQKLEFHPQLLDIEQFCRHLLEECQLLSRQHPLEFEQEGIPYLANVDEKLLHSIFSNLLSNAIKYSPNQTKIRFKIIYHAQEIEFQIEDMGIGIPLEDQQHLFESFHRGRNVGLIEGSGLGLAVVKKCLDLHQGRITVLSQEGKGSLFRVCIPRSG